MAIVWCSGRDLNPGSTARKADMLDRTTPPEHIYDWGFTFVYNVFALNLLDENYNNMVNNFER